MMLTGDKLAVRFLAGILLAFVIVCTVAIVWSPAPEPRDSCPADLGIELLRLGVQTERLDALTGELEGLMIELERFLETGR